MLLGKQCQSCGMPLKKDEEGGGTEKNGSKSTEYCSKCYQNGEFVNKKITANEMQELVVGKMRGMGMPNFMINFFMKDIPKLKRWSS